METKSGFLNDVSDHQREVLEIIKRYVYEELQVADHERWSEWYILRFCRARKFDVVKIKHMIQNYIKWMINMKFDKVNELDIHKFDKLRECSGSGYYNTDKKGRPIYIDKVRLLKAKDVFDNYQDEDLMAYYIQSYDRLIHIIFPECSRVANMRVEQSCTIMDLKDVNVFKLFSGKIKAFTKIATDIGQDYYPEILGKMYIINSGMLFSGIWMIVKQMIDAKTQAKISIISGSGKKELAAAIDLENLPVDLGGTCLRDVREDHGPWSQALELSYQNKSIYHHDRKLVHTYFLSEDEKREEEIKNAQKLKEESNIHNNVA
jgi:CRAL/TRIO domain/CRAL/TRIO, N-terminal domain